MRNTRKNKDACYDSSSSEGSKPAKKVRKYETSITYPINGMIFREGARVEVGSHEEGFVGAWFTASIRFYNIYNECCKVRYESILKDEGTKLFLEEDVHQSDIRPIPPFNFKFSWEVGAKVEAFLNDAWWMGGGGECQVGSRKLIHYRVSSHQGRVHTGSFENSEAEGVEEPKMV